MRISHLPLSQQPKRLPVALALAVSTFVLATVCSGGVGLGANVRISLADAMLYPAALLLPIQWCVLSIAVPYTAATLWLSGWQVALGMLLIKGVCAAAMAYVYNIVDPSTRSRTLVPFLAHCFLTCLGITLYDVFGFGLLTSLPALAVELVQWVLTGTLGTALVGSIDRWPNGLKRLLYSPQPSQQVPPQGDAPQADASPVG